MLSVTRAKAHPRAHRREFCEQPDERTRFQQARDSLAGKHIRTGGQDRSGDATLAPLADTDFANLPPTVLITAECDPLSSDGEAYRDRIVAAGGRANWFEEPGLVHGYLRARHTVGRARESFTRIVGAAAALGQGAWLW